MGRPWYGASRIIKRANGELPDIGSYLSSKKWKSKRRAAIEKAGNRCQNCGEEGPSERHLTVPLEIHHRTYERFGDELLEDLEVLCRQCHRKADAERREELGVGPEGYLTLC